ncbi:hypothetical protein [uncultured Gammaproteobacteria bacterium]|nr:hypothetical protein [uncultured Gammaproteobacteria bacterium]
MWLSCLVARLVGFLWCKWVIGKVQFFLLGVGWGRNGYKPFPTVCALIERMGL